MEISSLHAAMPPWIRKRQQRGRVDGSGREICATGADAEGNISSIIYLSIDFSNLLCEYLPVCKTPDEVSSEYRRGHRRSLSIKCSFSSYSFLARNRTPSRSTFSQEDRRPSFEARIVVYSPGFQMPTGSHTHSASQLVRRGSSYFSSVSAQFLPSYSAAEPILRGDF